MKQWGTGVNRGDFPGFQKGRGEVGVHKTEETGEFRDKENRWVCGGGVGTETEKQTGEKLGGRA